MSKPLRQGMWALSYFSSVLGMMHVEQNDGAHWQNGDCQVSLFFGPPPRVEITGTLDDDTTYRLVGYCAYHKIPYEVP
jgi:hypothetical protein